MSTLDVEETDPAPLRELTIEQRKSFRSDDENIKAAKALGILASNFLMMRPWCNSASDQGLNWDEHIYRHEDQYRKTYSGFSSCFERTLKSLVVKTRPEDVEKDIVLPPMKHRVVFLKPCWFDKMTANLFIQVLRANVRFCQSDRHCMILSGQTALTSLHKKFNIFSKRMLTPPLGSH